MKFFQNPYFGLIEILPCSLTEENLNLLKSRIEEADKMDGAIISLSKTQIKNSFLEVTLEYDWTALDDYGGAETPYIKKVREIVDDISEITLSINSKGIIALFFKMDKKNERYSTPSPALLDLFSRIVVKPLWTLGILDEIEKNILPHYYFGENLKIISRDTWPRLTFHSKTQSFEDKILPCLTENLKKNQEAESLLRFEEISFFWSYITFLSIYCERINILLSIEHTKVKCLIENYKSRISQLNYLGMEKFYKNLVNEIRWSLK